MLWNWIAHAVFCGAGFVAVWSIILTIRQQWPHVLTLMVEYRSLNHDT